VTIMVVKALPGRTKEGDKHVIGFEVNQKMASKKYWTFCIGGWDLRPEIHEHKERTSSSIARLIYARLG
jgi:hypothetical protein